MFWLLVVEKKKKTDSDVGAKAASAADDDDDDNKEGANDDEDEADKSDSETLTIPDVSFQIRMMVLKDRSGYVRENTNAFKKIHFNAIHNLNIIVLAKNNKLIQSREEYTTVDFNNNT